MGSSNSNSCGYFGEQTNNNSVQPIEEDSNQVVVGDKESINRKIQRIEEKLAVLPQIQEQIRDLSMKLGVENNSNNNKYSKQEY